MKGIAPPSKRASLPRRLSTSIFHAIPFSARNRSMALAPGITPRMVSESAIVSGTRSCGRLKFKSIDSRTYVPVEGLEKGVVHYLFNKELVEREFRRFKRLGFWVERGPRKWECYYCLLGEAHV